MPALKLGKSLPKNTPWIITYKKFGGEYPEKDYNTKEETGKKIYLYIFEKDGVEYTHYASEFQQESLRLFIEGDTLQVVHKQDPGEQKSMYLFTPTEGAEAQLAATPQSNNTTQERGVKQAVARIDKDKWISTQGFFQVRLGLGEKREEALMNAAFDYDALTQHLSPEKEDSSIPF